MTNINKATTSETVLIPINLQLFAEGDANESQSNVVDYSDDEFGDNIPDEETFDDDDSDVDDDVEQAEGEFDEISRNISDVADPIEPKQTPEENKIMQKMRQKAEADAKAKYEADRTALDAERKIVNEQIQANRQRDIEAKHYAAVTDEKIETFADEKGYSYEAAKEILIRDARLNATFEQTQLNQQSEINNLKLNNLKADRYFKFIKPEIDKLLAHDPKADVEGAYTYYVGEYVRSGKMDELIKASNSKTQKQTVADIADRARRKSVSGGDAGGGTDTTDPRSVLSKSSIEMSLAFGHDPKEIAKSVQEKLKNKKRR
jgi:hypothetical protein